MTDEEIIEVVTAHNNGQTIQAWGCELKEWTDCTTRPTWNFEQYIYRIKPEETYKSEPHYRPFNSPDEVLEAIKEHGDWIRDKYNRRDATKLLELSVGVIGYSDINIKYMGYSDAFDMFIFADGTPFGILEGE